MTWREISPDKFNALKNTLVIDVRSPCEHQAECIPNSINVPLLSDQERAVVGTIYKTEGEMIARRHALKLISPKIPEIIERIDQLREHGNTVVVYCWRGGMRSESVASVLSIAGMDTHRLTGGYKAWRATVMRDFDQNRYPLQFAVLHGLTGCGKTEILVELASRGFKVLDLEALANHRGSVFGGLGLGEQPTQKNFDAALWMELRRLHEQGNGDLVFVEAESRKVGRLALPDCVFDRIQVGVPILVNGSIEARAQRIVADYLNPAHNPEREISRGLELLSHLKERLGSKLVQEIEHLVKSGSVLEAVSLLLVHYYDPLYSHAIERHKPFTLEVNGDNPHSAADAISDLHKRTSPRQTQGEELVVVD